MKLAKLILLGLILCFCSSCSNIKSKKITDGNKDKIINEIAISKDLSEEERKLASAYIIRQNMAHVFQDGKPDIPTGKTVGEMIEDQRKWATQLEEQEKIEKEKEARLAAEIAAKERELREFVTVTLYGIREADAGFMKGFDARIAYKAGVRDIRAFQGNLVLSDVLGNSLGKIPVKVLTPLKANETGVTDYDNLYMAFPELQGKRLEDIKTQWTPSKIVFADSTELSLPNGAD
jgi:hypothetical protein